MHEESGGRCNSSNTYACVPGHRPIWHYDLTITRQTLKIATRQIMPIKLPNFVYLPTVPQQTNRSGQRDQVKGFSEAHYSQAVRKKIQNQRNGEPATFRELERIDGHRTWGTERCRRKWKQHLKLSRFNLIRMTESLWLGCSCSPVNRSRRGNRKDDHGGREGSRWSRWRSVNEVLPLRVKLSMHKAERSADRCLGQD